MFKCDMCGECCRNLKLSELYAELDDGSGKCKYLDGNKCSIYNERPLLCRVDEAYEMYFKNIMSKEDYYRSNYESCKELKRRKE